MAGRHLAIACAVLLCSAPAFAQDPDSPANPRRPFWKLFRDIGNDFKHLPSRDTLLWLSVGGATALALHPIDDDVNARLVGDPWVDRVFDPGAIAGQSYVQFSAAAITYAWGRIAKQPRVSHIGVDLLRAQLITYAMTYAIKTAARRERPDGSNGRSFPSGHASLTFATATVLQRHFGWRGALAYSAAGYVAASRLHENRHFLSDVVFGGALGFVAGRTVTRHGRDTWSLAPVFANGGGYALVLTVYSDGQ